MIFYRLIRTSNFTTREELRLALAVDAPTHTHKIKSEHTDASGTDYNNRNR